MSRESARQKNSRAAVFALILESIILAIGTALLSNHRPAIFNLFYRNWIAQPEAVVMKRSNFWLSLSGASTDLDIALISYTTAMLFLIWFVCLGQAFLGR